MKPHTTIRNIEYEITRNNRKHCVLLVCECMILCLIMNVVNNKMRYNGTVNFERKCNEWLYIDMIVHQ